KTIKYQWIHSNHLNMITHHKFLHVLAAENAILSEENNRYRIMMDSMVSRKAYEMMNSHIKIISESIGMPSQALTSEDELKKQVEALNRKKEEYDAWLKRKSPDGKTELSKEELNLDRGQ
ncbi:MAG: hypothetical protein ACP5RE_04215, partial [Candidatus Acidifodinimicrobium sp.]